MPGPLQAGFPGLGPGPALNCGAPQPRVLDARDFAGEMHLVGPERRAARRGPEFPKCPESFPWPRRLPAAAARGPTCPRAAGRGAAEPEGRRRPPPAERLSAAPPRPRLAPHAPSARRTHLASRTGRPREAGRRATRERPPPVAGPPARPPARSLARGVHHPPARAPSRRRGGSRARAGEGRGRRPPGKLARPRQSWRAVRRGRRSLLSLRSLAFSLTFPSSVSEESGPCARVCMALCVSACVLCARARARVWEGAGFVPDA